jgi:hypothetical protein
LEQKVVGIDLEVENKLKEALLNMPNISGTTPHNQEMV